MKRGQISIFIVLGLILLIMVAILFYLQDQETEPIGLEIIQTPSVFPVDTYITYCLENQARDAIKKLSLQGGLINLSSERTFITKTGASAMHFVSENGNSLITISTAEEELESYIESNLESCIDITEYERLEYSVTAGEISVDASINKEDVFVELDFPIKLEKDGEVIVEDYFSETLNLNLGTFLELATQITNAELQGPLNLDFFRLTYPNIHVLKEKPYPHSVYYLDTNGPEETSQYLAFTFVVGKSDLTSLKFIRPESLFEIKPQVDEGSCQIGNQCFSNTKEVDCQMHDGIYQAQESCVTQVQNDVSYFINSSFGDSCSQWFDLYTGEVIEETKLHGESWCSNDPGVGGRYYKLSCIDGEVIPESCSDYRDEICAQETSDLNLTQAICRPNRFWTCQTCDSEECCTNTNQRDCTWNKNLGCYPTADPGIKFWNDDLATQICSSGATNNPSSSISFFQSHAASCFSAGDCGSNINFVGDFTNQETVITKNIITEDFFKNLIKQQKNTSVSFDGEYFSNQFIADREFNPTPSFEFIEVLNSYLRNIDEMLAYDVDDILDPNIPITLQSFDVAQCEPWKPTQINRCMECGTYNPFDGTRNYAACSEYRCNSLGPDCVYQLRNGTGYCSSPYDDDVPLEVASLLPEGYEFEEEQTSLGDGIRITENIELHQPLKLQLDTNKNALCKLSYLPDKNFVEITGNDLTNQEYSDDHEISLTFNHDYDIFEKILDYFEKDSYGSIIDSLIDLRYKMETFKRQYPTVQKYSSGLYSILVPLVDYYLDDDTQFKLEMIFNNLDDKNYFIFLKCQDLAGYETSDYYFRFTLNDPCQDEEPPEILLHSVNGNGEFDIFVNEISTCSFDDLDVPYEQMRFEMDCERNPYAVTGIANGSYRCKGDISDTILSADNPKVYVKCQDHPEFLGRDSSFDFTIMDSLMYKDLNNLSGLNVSVQQTELMLFADLSVILDTKEYGSYEVYVNKSTQDRMELLFERPMQCNLGDLDLSCSATRCILPIDRDMTSGLSVSCQEKVPMCQYYNTNENMQSYEFDYEYRELLSIESTSYLNKTFIVSFDDSADAETDCGIQLQRSNGYISMKKDPSQNVFTHERTDNRVGAFFADVICLNKYGDAEEARIQYQ